jgi:hypothetical protein
MAASSAGYRSAGARSRARHGTEAARGGAVSREFAGDHRPVTPGRRGAIAETAIALAALRAGYEVYRPIAEGGRFDLVLIRDGELLRVQCKSGRLVRGTVVARVESVRTSGSGVVRRPYTAQEVDAVAIHCHDLDETYLLPIAIVERRSEVRLRLRPPRNNQAKRVRWAAQYRLGAIAQLGERLHGMQEVVGSSPTSSTP